MLAPGRPFGHPARQQVGLGLRQLSPRLRRRHHLVRLVRGDPGDQLALLGAARDDQAIAAAVAEHILSGVETQLAFASSRVGPVTLEAVLRQDRPDLPREVDLLRTGRARRPCRQE